MRLAATIDRMRHWSPDVICLQEVCVNFPFNTDGRNDDQVEQLNFALPEYQLVFAPTTDWHQAGLVRRFGNAVLTRWPIVCSRAHLLPSPVDWEAPFRHSSRSAAEVWIATPGGKIVRVLCTHLEYVSAKQRLAQANYLAETLSSGQSRRPVDARAEASPLDDPPDAIATILCGDMNCLPGAPELGPLTAASLLDLWTVANPDAPHAPTISVHYRIKPEFRPACFDHVYGLLSGNMHLRSLLVDAETRASDHQPLMLDLDIR